MVLNERNYNVSTIFIRSWQDRSAPKEWASAQSMVRKTSNELQTIDLSFTYRKHVLRELLDNYQQGNAPNPDIVCNLYLKFGVLQRFLEPIGAKLLATGHYSRSIWWRQRSLHFKTNCPTKDQSYFLYPINTTLMERSAFLLGSLKKREVRGILGRLGTINLPKSDSTGICLTNPPNFRSFLLEYVKTKYGPTEDESGNVVGEHLGIPFYVLGQRKRVAATSCLGDEKKMMVCKTCGHSNILTLRPDDKPSVLALKVLMIGKMGPEGRDINLNSVLLLKIRSQSQKNTFCFIFTSNLRPLQHRFSDLESDHMVGGCVIANMVKRQDGIVGQHAVIFKRGLCLGGGKVVATNNWLNEDITSCG